MSWLRLVPYLLAAGVAAALAAGVAWPLARAPLQAELALVREENAGLREAGAEAARQAALAVSARLQRAQSSGEAASARLAAALAKNDRLSQEKQHALLAATSGRACLSERALRVLDGAAGISLAGAAAGVPATAGEPAAAGGAVAAGADTAGPRVATDADVSGWMLQAGQRHEACREQLGALVDWINSNAPPLEPQRGLEE